jgi:hypothetical protein
VDNLRNVEQSDLAYSGWHGGKAHSINGLLRAATTLTTNAANHTRHHAAFSLLERCRSFEFVRCARRRPPIPDTLPPALSEATTLCTPSSSRLGVLFVAANCLLTNPRKIICS